MKNNVFRVLIIVICVFLIAGCGSKTKAEDVPKAETQEVGDEGLDVSSTEEDPTQNQLGNEYVFDSSNIEVAEPISYDEMQFERHFHVPEDYIFPEDAPDPTIQDKHQAVVDLARYLLATEDYSSISRTEGPDRDEFNQIDYYTFLCDEDTWYVMYSEAIDKAWAIQDASGGIDG